MQPVQIVTTISNVAVPSAILLIIVLKGFPLADRFVDGLQERNGELRELIAAIKDLVNTLKQRRW